MDEIGPGRVSNTATFPAPDFIDFDNDGDLDVMVGDDYGGLTYYENQGLLTSLFTGRINENDLKIYPNPALNELNVLKGESYIIYSALGELVNSGQIPQNRSIDISNLAKGMYIIQTNKGETSPFVKE